MRKVTEQISNALNNNKKLSISNTASTGSEMLLYGNCIIKKSSDDTLFTLAEWNTSTTRERLNGYLDIVFNSKFGFGQKNKKPVLQGRNNKGNFVVKSISDDKWYSITELNSIINS